MTAPVGAEIARKRQLTLLKSLAERAQWRSDIALPLTDVAPTLTLTHYSGGGKFVDKENPKYVGGSEFSYDLSMLFEQGSVKVHYLTSKQDNYGGVRYEDPALMLTPEGLAQVREFENRPPPDHWKDIVVWFRSKRWSVPVVLIGVGLGWCLGVIAGAKLLLQWLGFIK